MLLAGVTIDNPLACQTASSATSYIVITAMDFVFALVASIAVAAYVAMDIRALRRTIAAIELQRDRGESASSDNSVHSAAPPRHQSCAVPSHHLSVRSFTNHIRNAKTRSYVFTINGPFYLYSPLAPFIPYRDSEGNFHGLDEFSSRISTGDPLWSPFRASVMAANDAINAVGQLPSDPHLTCIELIFLIDTEEHPYGYQSLPHMEPLSVRSVSPSGNSSKVMAVMKGSHMSDLVTEIESVLPEFKSIQSVIITMSDAAMILLYMAYAGL